MSIFNYYPGINYNNQRAVHILSKAEVLNNSLEDQRKFFTYVVKNNERADIIAYREYGDPTLEWVIYLINGIVDPYKDWPLSESDFKKYLEKKYNTNAYLLSSVNNSVAYYYYQGLATDTEEEIAAYNYTLTKETYDALSVEEKSGWVAKSIFDYENEINESKREIILLKPIYLNDFIQQFKSLFSNG